MGEIAEMMLDGTMDCETGEWNFDGQDGPGFPMTGDQAAEYRKSTRFGGKQWGLPGHAQTPAHKVTKKLRAKIEKFGVLKNNDAYHWQVRLDGKIVADWWPHKGRYRIAGQKMEHGGETFFLAALAGQPQ
jgi:hypothetical protein